MFPGRENQPSRSELVDKLSELILQEVVEEFEKHEFDCSHLHLWNRDIRDYFWREEIKVVGRDFIPEDLNRWKSYWQEMVKKSVASKRIR